MEILLVEDEPHVRLALAKSLQAWGHTVTEAKTAADAGAALAVHPFGLIVLDINLPDASGWDVLRSRIPGLNRGTPAIVISAIAPSVSRLREFTPMGVLHKPFPIDSLHQLVNRADQQAHDSAGFPGRTQ